MSLIWEILPVKLLSAKIRELSLVRLDIDAGNSPSRWLLLRSRTSKDVILPISAGTVPVNLLFANFNQHKDAMYFRSAGMLPLNKLLDKSNQSILVQFVNISGGMTPWRLFPLNLKVNNLCILAKHGGKVPDS
jgi:hypothetical protein